MIQPGINYENLTAATAGNKFAATAVAQRQTGVDGLPLGRAAGDRTEREETCNGTQ